MYRTATLEIILRNAYTNLLTMLLEYWWFHLQLVVQVEANELAGNLYSVLWRKLIAFWWHFTIPLVMSHLLADISCINGRCSGFNHQISLLSFYKHFMQPLLQQPPEELQGSVSALLAQLPREPFNALKLRGRVAQLSLRAGDVSEIDVVTEPEGMPFDVEDARNAAEDLEWRRIGDKNLIVMVGTSGSGLGGSKMLLSS